MAGRQVGNSKCWREYSTLNECVDGCAKLHRLVRHRHHLDPPLPPEKKKKKRGDSQHNSKWLTNWIFLLLIFIQSILILFLLFISVVQPRFRILDQCKNIRVVFNVLYYMRPTKKNCSGLGHISSLMISPGSSSPLSAENQLKKLGCSSNPLFLLLPSDSTGLRSVRFCTTIHCNQPPHKAG